MKVQLYHATCPKSADLIERIGFRDRIGAKVSRWEGSGMSRPGFVYLTRAYSIYYAENAAGKDHMASVFLVEVDTKDLYPDEDFLASAGVAKSKTGDLERYKEFGELSLERLGNVAVRPEAIRILERRDLSTEGLWKYSDPSMSQMNYAIMGAYYRELSDAWFQGRDLDSVEGPFGSREQFIADTMKASAAKGGGPVGEI